MNIIQLTAHILQQILSSSVTWYYRPVKPPPNIAHCTDICYGTHLPGAVYCLWKWSVEFHYLVYV